MRTLYPLCLSRCIIYTARNALINTILHTAVLHSAIAPSISLYEKVTGKKILELAKDEAWKKHNAHVLPSSASTFFSSFLTSRVEHGRLPFAALFFSLHRRDTHIFFLYRCINKIITDPNNLNSADEQLNSTKNSDSDVFTHVFLMRNHRCAHTLYSSALPVLLSSVVLSHNILCACDYTRFSHARKISHEMCLCCFFCLRLCMYYSWYYLLLLLLIEFILCFVLRLLSMFRLRWYFCAHS